MIFGTLALSLFMMAAPPADVVVINLPAKGAVSLAMTPSGKADIERNGTLSQIRVEVDKVQTAQKLSSAMNAYVVWAVSPEGGLENVGELAIVDGKGRLDTTTRFDQFGILITAEPHFMVDRPNAVVAFRNLAPKTDNVRRMSVSVEVGRYDYSKLQPVTAVVPGLVAQARAALQVASGVQAERLAESEFRLAQIALGTVDEMIGRATPLEVLLPVANESIRRSQRAFVLARENAVVASLDSARNDATLLKKDAQQLQDRIQQLTTEHAATLEQVRKLDSDLAGAVRDRQQVGAALDAAKAQVQALMDSIADLRRQLYDLQTAPSLRLPAEYFDVSAGALTAMGSDALTKIAAAVAVWSDPVRIACPKNAVEILKKFFVDASVPPARVIIIADR